MTEQQHADAIIAALNTALSPRIAYDFSAVPATRPPQYVVIALARTFGGPRRTSDQVATTGYQVTVRAVSQARISDVRVDLEKCRAALERKQLTVGGNETTRIRFHSERSPGPDANWFSGSLDFTYAISE